MLVSKRLVAIVSLLAASFPAGHILAQDTEVSVDETESPVSVDEPEPPIDETEPEPEPEPECFTSTRDILYAQISNPTPDDVYIICPDTTIDIGVPNAEFTDFNRGDWPLTAIRSGITILCGESGEIANNCNLNGGYVQFLTVPRLTIPNRLGGGEIEVETNDLLVQGITFTGVLVEPPVNPGLPRTAVSLQAPGTGMVFDDCGVVDWTGQAGFIGGDAGLFDGSPSVDMGMIEFTIQDSIFQDIEYEFLLISDAPDGMIQNYFVDGCLFENIVLVGEELPSEVLSPSLDLSPSGDEVRRLQAGAESSLLIGCYDGSTCTLTKLCFLNVEFGATLINESLEPPSNVDFSDLRTDPDNGIRTVLPADADPLCLLGLSTGDTTTEFVDCIDPFSGKKCPFNEHKPPKMKKGKGKGSKGKSGKGGKSKGGKKGYDPEPKPTPGPAPGKGEGGKNGGKSKGGYMSYDYGYSKGKSKGKSKGGMSYDYDYEYSKGKSTGKSKGDGGKSKGKSKGTEPKPTPGQTPYPTASMDTSAPTTKPTPSPTSYPTAYPTSSAKPTPGGKGKGGKRK